MIILSLKDAMSPREFNISFYANAIRNLLPTLGLVDFFTILAGNESFSPVLVRGTQQNFANVTTDFLPTLNYEPEGLAELTERAFEILRISRENNGNRDMTSSQCQSAVIIITDSEILAHEISENLTSAFGASESIKIFINSNVSSVGFKGATEREIACNNSGTWNNITSKSDPEAYELINSYFMILARFVRQSSPLWSEIQNDSQGFISSGATLCLPVYSENENTSNAVLVNELLGVTCIDLPIDEVRRVDPSGGLRVS